MNTAMQTFCVHIVFIAALCNHCADATSEYNFANQSHFAVHTCSRDFRQFSRQILFESVLLCTTRNVCHPYGWRNWKYTGNLTEMPQKMTELYKYSGPIAAECASVYFEARVAVPGILRHVVPHAQLTINVDVCVRGAHAYHTVYISECPLFGSFVFSHDIAAWTQNSKQTHKAIVTTDVKMYVPWVLQSIGQSIVNDISLQTRHDLDILIDSMCFNMSARHV